MAKVWNVNIDCSVRQGSQLLFDLKTLLLANGWTITATSDGTNFTNGSSPDRVSTVALFDVANAYYVLGDPAGKVWLSVQRRAANTTFTIKVARVAPQANGTATVMPTTATAADETTVLNNGTFASSSAVARGHIVTYDAAENAAGIRPVYVTMTQGTPTLLGAFAIEALANDTYASLNAWPYCTGHASGNNLYLVNTLTWTWYYSPTSVWATYSSWYQYFNVFVYLGGSTAAGVDPWNNQDSGLPMVMGRPASTPQPGVVGFLKNIRIKTVNRSYPDTMTLTSGDRFVYFGDCIIPYADGVNPA